MKSKKLKTTIRPINKKYLIVKSASQHTQGHRGIGLETTIREPGWSH